MLRTLGRDGISLGVVEDHGRTLAGLRAPVPRDVTLAYQTLALEAFRRGNRVAPLCLEWLGVERILDAGPPACDVSILIPVRGALDKLAVCLQHVARIQTRRMWEVVISCPEDERRECERLVDRSGLLEVALVQILATESPLGYPANVNNARCKATGAVLVTLNSDAYVPPGILDTLCSYFDESGVVAVGPANQHRVAAHDLLTENTIADLNGDLESDSFVTSRITGFCMAVRASAWNSVGGLDERYGLGNYDDDDLCLRLSLVGDVLADRTLVVGHSVSASFAALGQEVYRKALSHGEAAFAAKWGWFLADWQQWMAERGAVRAGGIVG